MLQIRLYKRRQGCRYKAIRVCLTETFNTFCHTLFILAWTWNSYMFQRVFKVQKKQYCDTTVTRRAHVCHVVWTASSDASASKPYQGVRVKDPVKELLRRKRGNGARPARLTTAVGTAPHAHPHVHAHSIRSFYYWNRPLTCSYSLCIQVLACCLFFI